MNKESEESVQPKPPRDHASGNPTTWQITKLSGEGAPAQGRQNSDPQRVQETKNPVSWVICKTIYFPFFFLFFRSRRVYFGEGLLYFLYFFYILQELYYEQYYLYDQEKMLFENKIHSSTF